jgi:hypothetical protein
MTKRQAAIARKREWSAALAEGRVVRFEGGARLTSYATREAAAAAVAEARAAGLAAKIVIVPA